MSSPGNRYPRLRGRFHLESPDDLQVIIHDGGQHITDRLPELVWVRLTGCQGEAFTGVVLNKPVHLQSVVRGSQILFIMPEGGPYPLQVTPQYLEERPQWRLLAPCRECGLTELFGPPSELLAASFPSVTTDQLSRGFTFTTRCRLCGDGVVVRIKRANRP